jgi:hypothetical protein
VYPLLHNWHQILYTLAALQETVSKSLGLVNGELIAGKGPGTLNVANYETVDNPGTIVKLF